MQKLYARRGWVERKLVGNEWEMSGGEWEGGKYEEKNKLKVVGMVMGMVGMNDGKVVSLNGTSYQLWVRRMGI